MTTVARRTIGQHRPLEKNTSKLQLRSVLALAAIVAGLLAILGNVEIFGDPSSGVNPAMRGRDNGGSANQPVEDRKLDRGSHSIALANAVAVDGGGANVVTDSSTASVIAMASGYGFDSYQKFVGSLRKSGYRGHIILGTAPDVNPGVAEYLAKLNVTVKQLSFINCTFWTPSQQEEAYMDPHAKERITCAAPYDNIKLRWSRFPLARDWLVECETCTGPVLLTDFRDTFFQRDPFLGASIEGLQVFEEHYWTTTDHWLVSHPIQACKGITIDHKPMLCSGTTVGTRETMIRYLELMYDEMKVWAADDKCCCFKMNGDDQTMHNYLYYGGRMKFATAFKQREGIVHTTGHEAAKIREQHIDAWKAKGKTQGESMGIPYGGADLDGTGRWIGGKHANLTDDEGYFLNFDGTRSRVIHQYDRWGQPFIHMWLDRQKGKLYD